MNQKKILVVDDEKHMQMLLKFNLQKTGCMVDTVGSGVEAIQWVEQQKPDLILIDLVMPGMDGFSTLAALRAMPGLENTPVIILTSRGQVDIREKASGLGISLFLTKPFSPLELIQQAKTFLETAS